MPQFATVLADVPWTAPVQLKIPSDEPRSMTLFEAIYTLAFSKGVDEGQVLCSSGRFALDLTDVTAICGRTRPSRAKPTHGHEANAVILDGGPGGAPIKPVFSGKWDVACARIWRLPAARRANGYVVSHDTVYDPAWLERHRPTGPRLLRCWTR